MIVRLLFLMLLAISSANAATLKYSFKQGGFDESAYVTGKFAGEDANNDGVLSSSNGEISYFSMSFSGNSTIAAFTADSTNSINFDLEYYINDNSLGALYLDNEDPYSNPDYYPYLIYNGFGGRTENHELFTGLIEEGEVIRGYYFSAQTLTLDAAEIKNETINNVPIPTSIYLFNSGLVALFLTRFKKTRKHFIVGCF